MNKCCACIFEGKPYLVGVTTVNLCSVHRLNIKKHHPELLVFAIVEEKV